MVELLHSVQDLARPRPGFLGGWISEEDPLPNDIRYIEQWDSESSLQEHVRSQLYRRVLAAMELSELPPEVNFYFCSESKRLELIDTMRKHPEI
jgi:quinol monooxygenase YgiN